MSILGYEKHAAEQHNSGDSRNGRASEKVRSEFESKLLATARVILNAS